MRVTRISQEGIDLIKKWEGLKLEAYKCPAGKNTIGYGHVLKPHEKEINITEKEAHILLMQDINKVQAYLTSVVRIILTQGQFDALCSLVYNWGTANFGNSTGLQLLNDHDRRAAANEFFSKEHGVVNIAGKFSKGLYNRRQSELKLFKS